VHGQEQALTIAGRSVVLFPLYHPAAALYTPATLETLRADFQRIPELLARGAPAQPETQGLSEPPEPGEQGLDELPQPEELGLDDRSAQAGSAEQQDPAVQLGLF